MSEKKPERWNDPIIQAPFATLTKKQVFKYYTNPVVKNEILKAVGNREVVVRQSFSPGKDVLRRKDPLGHLIKFETPKEFRQLAEKRLSEVHPTFGRHVNFLLADIDPQKNVPWEKTKAIAETVAKTMKMHPDVKKVEVQFSGGRGFYVRGIMDKAIKVDQARALTQKVLHGITKRPDVTFGVTHAPDQIRLDTTPLKFRGSVRAPMSLNASTGLVAAPVSLAKLPKVEKSDFTIQKIIKRAAQMDVIDEENNMGDQGVRVRREGEAETNLPDHPSGDRMHTIKDRAERLAVRLKTAAAGEFAPGIPKARTTHPIPDIQNKAWTLAIQQHNAFKAGPHWDVRLVDPKTHHAHSFAVPKMKFPGKGETILGIQQPTHKSRYALKFEGDIPKGVYGGGSVKMHLKEPVDVIKANANRIVFQRPGGDKLVMFRMDEKKWGIRQLT
jgi:hypothetical protein